MANVTAVDGLADLQKALRAYPKAVRKQIVEELKQPAQEVATAVRRQMPVRTGAAARSVRVVASSRYLAVRAGGKAVPYYGWLDFGGTLAAKDGRHNTQHRPRFKEGRWMYPTADRHRAQVTQAGLRAVEKAKSQVFRGGRARAVSAGVRVGVTRRALRQSGVRY